MLFTLCPMRNHAAQLKAEGPGREKPRNCFLTSVYYYNILRIMNNLPDLENCTGFEWDEHNSGKIQVTHRVSPRECEEVLFNLPLVVTEDVKHSTAEQRYHALGLTSSGRPLFVVFTLRGKRIRVISARDMHRKERRFYQSS